MSSNNEVQYEAFRRHDTTPKPYQPRLCWYSLLVLEVDGENSRNKFFLQYRTVVFITPACARNLNGASASEPSPAPQILKHSLIHPANILPQNQTKPSHIQIPNPLSTVRSTHPHLHQNLFLTSRAPGRTVKPFLFFRPMDLCIMRCPSHLISHYSDHLQTKPATHSPPFLKRFHRLALRTEIPSPTQRSDAMRKLRRHSGTRSPHLFLLSPC